MRLEECVAFTQYFVGMDSGVVVWFVDLAALLLGIGQIHP